MSAVPDALRLLGDPLRARIVELLAAEELCTCHLAAELNAKQPLISYHLKALRDAGLIEAEPCGRFTYYRLSPDAVDVLASGLAGLAAQARHATKRAC